MFAVEACPGSSMALASLTGGRLWRHLAFDAALGALAGGTGDERLNCDAESFTSMYDGKSC